jgi:pimeloyl-ACP methyl ester carboxylesterase
VRRLKATLLASTVAVGTVGGLAVSTTMSSAATVAPKAPVPASAPAAAVTPATGVAAAATSGVAWGKCADETLQKFGAVCGTLSVPLDYGKPKGAKIKLALSMVKHKTTDPKKYQGVMLVNPGGPGGSGLIYSILQAFVPKHGGDGYDWIGFDPRGVGDSTPRVNCDPKYFAGPRPLYEPVTPQLERTWLAKSKGYAQACGKNAGALLSHMKTTDWARDMDSIRVALGQKQINYYGYSYGTYLGQVYATLFPGKVRRAVLDGVVNPKRVWYQANLDQDFAFERNIKIFFAWVAKYDAVYHLGSTAQQVEDRFYQQRFELAQSPAGGVVGADEWTDIFLGAGYNNGSWIGLGKLWSDYEKTKDAAPLVEAANNANGVGDDNLFAVYNAVQCTDTQWPTSWAQWRRDNWRTYADARFNTWGNVWFNAPCLFWPAKAGKAVTVNGSKTPPILLVSETLDAATPYSGALEARKLFPTSRLLAIPGGVNHAGSLLSGNACEDVLVADYLLTGKLPARKKGAGPDATCAALPFPDPTAPAPAATKQAPQVADNPRVAPLRRLLTPGVR